MQITLARAFELLDSCSAIVIDDDVLCYPALDDVTDDPENEFMYCKWYDKDGDEMSVTFRQEDNENPTIHDNYLVLVDTEGNTCNIKLLEAMSLYDKE